MRHPEELADAVRVLESERGGVDVLVRETSSLRRGLTDTDPCRLATSVLHVGGRHTEQHVRTE
jgi:hypothetical protein